MAYLTFEYGSLRRSREGLVRKLYRDRSRRSFSGYLKMTGPGAGQAGCATGATTGAGCTHVG